MPQYGNTPTDCEDKLSGYFCAYVGGTRCDEFEHVRYDLRNKNARIVFQMIKHRH